ALLGRRVLARAGVALRIPLLIEVGADGAAVADADLPLEVGRGARTRDGRGLFLGLLGLDGLRLRLAGGLPDGRLLGGALGALVLGGLHLLLERGEPGELADGG